MTWDNKSNSSIKSKSQRSSKMKKFVCKMLLSVTVITSLGMFVNIPHASACASGGECGPDLINIATAYADKLYPQRPK